MPHASIGLGSRLGAEGPLMIPGLQGRLLERSSLTFKISW